MKIFSQSQNIPSQHLVIRAEWDRVLSLYLEVGSTRSLGLRGRWISEEGNLSTSGMTGPGPGMYSGVSPRRNSGGIADTYGCGCPAARLRTIGIGKYCGGAFQYNL